MTGSGRRGFTLLELTVAAGILAIVMTAIFQLVITTDKISQETDEMAQLEANTLKIIERLTLELLNCSDDPASGFNMEQGLLTASPVTGFDYDTQEPVYGDFFSWTTVYDDGELDDGIDNDGDHLIDEMKLIRTSGSDVEVISNRVAENGLLFTKTDKEVVISLTLVGYVPKTNSIISRTISPVTVALRN